MNKFLKIAMHLEGMASELSRVADSIGLQGALDGHPDLIDHRKFSSRSGDIYLLLVNQSSRDYLIRVDKTKSISYDLIASGPKSKATLRRLGDFILYEEGELGGDVQEGKASESEIDLMLKRVFHGKYGLQLPSSDNDPEFEDFSKRMSQFIRDWMLDGSGENKRFPIMNHPYWAEYKKSLEDSLRKAHGGSVTLYRGLHGDFSRQVASHLPVHRYSSWTADRGVARDFARYGYVGDLSTGFSAKVLRKGPWVVVSSKFDVADVVLAPVQVDALADPQFLAKKLASQDEYVVHSNTSSIPVKVVSRSKT
jgi:hypothetical protein